MADHDENSLLLDFAFFAIAQGVKRHGAGAYGFTHLPEVKRLRAGMSLQWSPKDKPVWRPAPANAPGSSPVHSSDIKASKTPPDVASKRVFREVGPR